MGVTYGRRWVEVSVAMPPAVRELAGKRRKRARMWRRANPRPWQIDTDLEARKLAEAILIDLEEQDRRRFELMLPESVIYGDGDGDGDG